jgi:hypothetical protein
MMPTFLRHPMACALILATLAWAAFLYFLVTGAHL